MHVSRRSFFRRIGAGAVATAAIPALDSFALARGLAFTRARQPGGPILLDRNENAYGPSVKVIAAIRDAAGSSNRYPRSTEEMEERLAHLHGVQRDQVVLTCGSGEVLRMAAEAFLGPGKKLIEPVPTFEALGKHAKNAGAEVVEVPLTKTYAHDLPAMLRNADAATGLVYICNPNNPTGSLTPREEIEDFLRRVPAGTHALIDEAYHHYVGASSSYASFLDRPVSDPRVIVARTFSKIYGLAGLRVGYAVAAPEVARKLAEERLPVGVNILGMQAAGVALDDTEHVRETAERNRNDRQEFMNQANDRMLQAIDSHANFVLLESGRRVDEVLEFFKKNGIILGRRIPSIEKYVRVSLGTPDEMAEFWRVWDMFLPHKM